MVVGRLAAMIAAAPQECPMQVQEAINLVQAKFVAESKGETDGEVAERYQSAFADFPVVMEVATIIIAQGLITQNYQAAMRKAQEQQDQHGGNTPGGGAPIVS